MFSNSGYPFPSTNHGFGVHGAGVELYGALAAHLGHFKDTALRITDVNECREF